MHEGHRRRMYEKLKNDDGLHDHEILEILLFNAFRERIPTPWHIPFCRCSVRFPACLPRISNSLCP